MSRKLSITVCTKYCVCLELLNVKKKKRSYFNIKTYFVSAICARHYNMPLTDNSGGGMSTWYFEPKLNFPDHRTLKFPKVKCKVFFFLLKVN